MNFSRFFKHSTTFFLLCFLAFSARPIGFKDYSFGNGQPLFFEIPGLHQPIPFSYTSILSDKGNRLFITTEHEVFIYDGNNCQQIKVPGNPIIAYDGNDRILLAGNSYLSLLTLNSTGCYSAKNLIDSSTSVLFGQITSIGFGTNKNIYFSSGTKLWTINEKPVVIDSSKQNISVYSTHNDLIFYSAEKNFYATEGQSFKLLSKGNYNFSGNILGVFENSESLIAVTSHNPWFYCLDENKPNSTEVFKRHLKSNEEIIKVTFSGSHIFIATSSNRLLMLGLHGQLVNCITNFGAIYSDFPVDICTPDDVNFFAITHSKILHFINPLMVQVFNNNVNLLGNVKKTVKIGSTLFVATSFGLYTANNTDADFHFNLICEGEFHDLYFINNQLFATGKKGLFSVNKNWAERVSPESFDFSASYIVESKNPKAVFLNSHSVYSAELTPPFKLQKIQSDKNQSFTNLYKSGSFIFLKSEKNNLFIFDQDKPSLSECKRCTDDNSSFILPTSKSDTIVIINDQIAKVKKTGLRIVVGKTTTNQTIVNSVAGFHPNFQSIIIDSLNTNQNAIIALDNSLKINAVSLESDFGAWLSTSNGLIRFSKDYIKHNFNTHPSIYFYSISSIKKDVTTPMFHGFAQWTDTSIGKYKIKQGCVLEFILGGLSNYDFDNLTYTYKLDGVNSKWSNWSTDSKIKFDDLASGNYSFKFKARNALGYETPELTFDFRVMPIFFKTQFTLIALIIFILIVTYTIIQWRNFNHALERFKLESIINRRTEELIKEKEKTDNLLARVLPRETATELKETGKVNTQKFNMVTVLFSDIQGFTRITDELNPENLIDQLDKFFLYFDSVVDKYKIEKIKTIGDAYMCAGGIPHKNRTNPVEVVLAALEMMYFMREINLEHNPGQDIWDLRIGIDTGPVIAGVVGRNKLTYDIWGTTVNTASRMESSGEVGKINISGNTHILVQEYFLCTYRGKMPIKNKGDIEMYFVEGIKPAFSNNLDMYRPNNEFQVQLQFLRFGDLEEFILEKLEKGLPKNLHYHNLKHTVDVYTQVELIGRSENVSLEEQLLLQTAALLHDSGHLIDYDTHEEMGVKLAREILPDYQYTERQIEIISELIMVTKLPPKPKNLLEAIMCDADLDYLGRTDFIPVSNMLYKELHEHGRIGTIQEWNELQIKFIEKHQYFTNTARRLRNVNKNSQLDNIKKWIEKNKL